jgi:hypothetical protein
MAAVSDVVVVADSDTRWKWGAALVGRIAPTARVHATLLLGRSAPTERQLADVGARPDTLRRASLAEAVPLLAATDAQVIVLACLGGTVQALLRALGHAWSDRPGRPVLVTGYVGLVYEHVVDGLLGRAGADIVLANSAADAERFREIFAAAGVDPSSVVPAALPFLGGAQHDPNAAGRDRPFTVTFVAQPSVPIGKAERQYALAQAGEHARRYPAREVLVKLRGRLGERTTHAEPYHYAKLIPAAELPPNLGFVYGSMDSVLDRTDLCVTVSSTAAIEAMDRGIPTAVLVDFGVREVLGNQLFLGSGALTSWRALHEGALPRPDPQWLARNGGRDPAPFALAQKRLAELLDAGPLPAVRPWLTAADGAGYLPQLMAGHGLHVDGAPLAVTGPGDSVARRAVRAVSRRMYTVGVRVLEPGVKRMAQL